MHWIFLESSPWAFLLLARKKAAKSRKVNEQLADGAVSAYLWLVKEKSWNMATGSGQLCFHSKNHYLFPAELHAKHNYYKIWFSHVNYYLHLINIKPLSKRMCIGAASVLLCFTFSTCKSRKKLTKKQKKQKSHKFKKPGSVLSKASICECIKVSLDLLLIDWIPTVQVLACHKSKSREK